MGFAGAYTKSFICVNAQALWLNCLWGRSRHISTQAIAPLLNHQEHSAPAAHRRVFFRELNLWPKRQPLSDAYCSKRQKTLSGLYFVRVQRTVTIALGG